MDDPREPMTVEEVEELLKATLHGPLPQTTVWRMMATLAEWRQLPAQLEAARGSEKNAIKRMDEMGAEADAAFKAIAAKCEGCEENEWPRHENGGFIALCNINKEDPCPLRKHRQEDLKRREAQGSRVCLGCGKTFAECKCTDEEIEYHKRLEREQKAE